VNENKNLEELRKQALLPDSTSFLYEGAPIDVNDEESLLIKNLIKGSEIHV
jgi:hypothetical protein